MPASRPPLHADEILTRLTARGIDFVVIGGIAAVLHGSAQATYDLDICYATDPGNLAALGELLVVLGACLKGVEESVPFAPDAATLRRGELLTLVTRHGALDILARPIGSHGYEALRRNADRFDLDGFSILVASLDDLIAMKRLRDGRRISRQSKSSRRSRTSERARRTAKRPLPRERP